MKQPINNVLDFLPSSKRQSMKKQNKAVIRPHMESEPKELMRRAMISIPEVIYQKVKTSGKRNRRNVSAEIAYALTQYYNLEEPQSDKDAAA